MLVEGDGAEHALAAIVRGVDIDACLDKSLKERERSCASADHV